MSTMDEAQTEKNIESFLRRCAHRSADALNIAKFLGLQYRKDVNRILYRMKYKGIIIVHLLIITVGRT